MDIINSISDHNNDLSKSQVEGILYLVLKEPELTNSALVRKTGLPKETLRRFKSSIASLLQEEEDEKILLKREIASELREVNLSPYSWSLVDYENPELEKQLVELRKEHNLQPKREYDQFFATENTSVSKMEIMRARGDIKNKRIALLGDDDLVSIVLGLSSEVYTQITVFDIDKDILGIIDKISDEKNLQNIRTEFYDAREPIRPDLRAHFDVVVIDPPYTSSGVRLFLERALSLLGPTNEDSIYLYYGNSFKTPEKTFQIQDLVSKYNLLIKEKIDNFARYYGAESIGSSSSLYLLETFAGTKRPVDKKITDIYTHQKRQKGDFPFVEHFTFKLYDVSERIVTSKNYLQKALGKFCKYHRLKVVNTEEVKFSGGGYTFNYTLASSSLTLHTWPEMNALHLVLITCEPLQKKDRLYENLSSLFKTEKIEIQQIE